MTTKGVDMPKPQKLIKRYSSAIIEGMVCKISASSPLKHKLTKGELRELFITSILKSFLTKQFDIGTGIIINQKEEQSNQTDIIIYDNRILPPFIKEQHIGVYPAESVVGVIEVKSKLDRNAIINSEKSAKKLIETIYNPKSSIYEDYKRLKPLCATVGFYGTGSTEIRNEETGKTWLDENIKHNFAICLVGKFSWMNLQNSGWVKSDKRKNYEETKRFIAVFLDNLRTRSETKLMYMSLFAHKDWLGVYMRDQNLFYNDELSNNANSL
jgi:hypothetical protein